MAELRISKAFLIAVACVVVFLGGCVTAQHVSGVAINDADVAKIVKGKTTVDEVVALFGEPTKSTTMRDEVIYAYEYRITKSNTVMFPIVTSSDSKDEVDKLSIVFDKNNVVTTFNLKRGIAKPN